MDFTFLLTQMGLHKHRKLSMAFHKLLVNHYPSSTRIIKHKSNSIPSNLSPCPWPRQSGDTAIQATSPHFSSKWGKRAAQAIMWPSLSTTMNESNVFNSYKQRMVKIFRYIDKLPWSCKPKYLQHTKRYS